MNRSTEHITVSLVLVVLIASAILIDHQHKAGIIEAAERNECARMKRILALRPHLVNTRDKFGRTPFHIATERSYKDLMQILLAGGADINAADRGRKTPLYAACGRQGHAGIVTFLLDNGANVNAATASGDTPLHRAATSGNEAVTGLLIDAGADLTAINGNGDTPLHAAVKAGYVRVVRLLAEKGADVSAEDSEGRPPVDYALRRGRRDLAQVLRDHGAEE